MREILAFWILNVILNRFHLYLNEIGLFYKNPKNNVEYLIDTNINEGLNFLNINLSFKMFSSLSLHKMFKVIENCDFYNKALYLSIEKRNLTKLQKQQVGIIGYLDRINNRYDDFISSYKFVRCDILYDFIVYKRYFDNLKLKVSPKKVRKEFIKSKINTEIVMLKYRFQSLKLAEQTLNSFKDYIQNSKLIIYEQFIIHNNINDIFVEFDKFLDKIKNPYTNTI